MSPTKKDPTTQDKSSTMGADHDGTLSPVASIQSVPQQPTDLFDDANSEVNFRGVSWQGAAVLVTKVQIGLGVLSLPSTFHVLGFFPGIFCFIILAIISTVAGYICGNARQYYPHMHSIGDAAEMLFGETGREVIGIIYYIYLALVAGAGMLTTSASLNALSEHGACTTIFLGVTCAASFILGTGFRSLEKVSWLSWLGVAGIIVSIWITAIACLTQDRPAAAPADGSIDLDIRVLPQTTFLKAMGAISTQLFALLCGQAFIVATNIVIGSMVYGKVGQYIASPALGSAGPLIKKISYGIALPGLLVTAVLWSHIAAKYSFVRILRGTRHLQSNTIQHWAVWAGSMAVTVVFGFIVVGVVPFFDDFLSLVGALFNPVFTNVIPGFMILFFIARQPVKAVQGGPHPRLSQSSSTNHWLVDSFLVARGGWKYALGFTLAWFMVLSGFLIMVCGTHATVLSIKAAYGDGSITGVFSCVDNS